MPTLGTTLFFAGNPGFVSDDNTGGACNPVQILGLTAAGSHDASDGTALQIASNGDGVSTNPDFVTHTCRTIQTSSVVGSIAFIRVVSRTRYTSNADISTNSSWRIFIDDVEYGLPKTVTASFAYAQEDLTTDPSTGLPWTNAGINAKRFGISMALNVTDSNFICAVTAQISEWYLEVWVGTPLTLSPATIELTTKVYERFDTPQTEAVVYSGPQDFGSFAIIDPEYYETGSNQRGIVSHGLPYFMVAAMSGIQGGPQYEGPTRPGTSTMGIEVMFKLHRPPQQLNSSREIHALVAFCSQINKRTTFGIGVTPDLGVAFISNQDPPFMITPPGTIRVGERVVVRATSKATFRNLQVNDQQFNDTRSGVQIGVATGHATFPSLFGDLTGLSRITGEISGVNYYNSLTQNWCYPLNEGVGLFGNALINDNVDLPTGTPASQHGVVQGGVLLDATDAARLKLTAIFEHETGFLPLLGFPWGPPNTTLDVHTAFHWGARQGYDLAGNPIQSPFFHPRFGSGSSFSPRGPAVPTYERR